MFADTFTSDGVVFNMGFPENEYEFKSPLAGLKRSAEGFKGMYNPVVYGKWKVELVFFEPGEDIKVEVNGIEADYERTKKGIVFFGEGGGDKPLRWSINS